MQSPSSVVAFGPNVCSERRPMCRGVMDVANKRESSRSMSYSSAITSRSKPAVGISPSPSTPRRRASQGSLRPAWSPVSRFVSKETSPLQLPSFESLGISTSIPQKAHPRSLSADHSPQRSPLRPGRASLSGPPPVFETVQDSSRGDYATSLPLTPPADDDEHVSWNPQSDAPIFDAHINNREPKPQGHMDESRNRQSSSPSETRDDVYSPTDRKPSGRPPDEDERMAGEQSGSWLANSIDATSKFDLFILSFCFCLVGADNTLFSFVAACLQSPRGSRPHCLADPAVSPRCRPLCEAANAECCLRVHCPDDPGSPATGTVSLHQCHPCGAGTVQPFQSTHLPAEHPFSSGTPRRLLQLHRLLQCNPRPGVP